MNIRPFSPSRLSEYGDTTISDQATIAAGTSSTVVGNELGLLARRSEGSFNGHVIQQVPTNKVGLNRMGAFSASSSRATGSNSSYNYQNPPTAVGQNNRLILTSSDQVNGINSLSKENFKLIFEFLFEINPQKYDEAIKAKFHNSNELQNYLNFSKNLLCLSEEQINNYISFFSFERTNYLSIINCVGIRLDQIQKLSELIASNSNYSLEDFLKEYSHYIIEILKNNNYIYLHSFHLYCELSKIITLIKKEIVTRKKEATPNNRASIVKNKLYVEQVSILTEVAEAFHNASEEKGEERRFLFEKAKVLESKLEALKKRFEATQSAKKTVYLQLAEVYQEQAIAFQEMANMRHFSEKRSDYLKMVGVLKAKAEILKKATDCASATPRRAKLLEEAETMNWKINFLKKIIDSSTNSTILDQNVELARRMALRTQLNILENIDKLDKKKQATYLKLASALGNQAEALDNAIKDSGNERAVHLELAGAFRFQACILFSEINKKEVQKESFSKQVSALENQQNALSAAIDPAQNETEREIYLVQTKTFKNKQDAIVELTMANKNKEDFYTNLSWALEMEIGFLNQALEATDEVLQDYILLKADCFKQEAICWANVIICLDNAAKADKEKNYFFKQAEIFQTDALNFRNLASSKRVIPKSSNCEVSDLGVFLTITQESDVGSNSEEDGNLIEIANVLLKLKELSKEFR